MLRRSKSEEKIQAMASICEMFDSSKKDRRAISRHRWMAAITGCVLFMLGGAPAFAEDHGEPAWYDRIDFGGDFRGRDEVFVREGEKDRHRLRYRLRLGATSEINDHIDFGFRLSTGKEGSSANQTLGEGIDPGVDFSPDGIYIDRAYITIKPYGAQKPAFGDSMSASFGKTANPFRPKDIGPALLMWDSDLMPEGVSYQWSASPRADWDTNLDVAYYLFDENNINPSRDPAIFAVQLDNAVAVREAIQFTSQVSYYALRKLDRDFKTRNIGIMGDDDNRGRGNTDGLTSNNHIDLVEFHGGTTFSFIDGWPVTLWGNVIFNLSAEGVGEGKQDTGFGAGIEIGSKSAIAQLGVAYFELEADAVPGILADSDFLDGATNGKSWMLYLTKTILKNTDFQVVTFFSDELDDDVAALQNATPGDRVRVQTNVVVTF